MKVLPYDTFTLSTPDPLPVVLQRLNSQVEPTKAIRFSREHAPYQGTLSEDSFKISRIIHHRNACLPVIRGRFESKSYETLVHIEMKLHSFTLVFICWWFLLWYSTIIPLLFADAMHPLMRLLFLGMPIFILFAFWTAFWSEANRSREDLTKIIQGQVI